MAPPPQTLRIGARDSLTFLFRFCIAGVALASVLGLAGPWYWWFDHLAHLRLQYVLVAAVCVIGLGSCRSWRWAAVAAACVTLNGMVVHDRLVRGTPDVVLTEESPESIRIFYANVLTMNEWTEGLLSQIEDADPDVVVLLEIDDRWIEEITPLARIFPHSVVQPRSDNFGIGVFSRLPLEGEEVFQLRSASTNWDVPAVEALVGTPSGPTRLIAVHTVPPVTAEATLALDEQLALLVRHIEGSRAPTIVIGDLNTTPFSCRYSRLVEGAALRGADRSSWSGLTSGTWPAGWPAAGRLTLDHALVTRDLEVVETTPGEPFGSDHLPLVIDIAHLPGP